MESFEYPHKTAPGFEVVVEEFKDLFRTSPGVTSEAQHYIPTTGNPVRVPPRRIPAHYRDEVEQQIQEMLDLGIIEESSSPWMAPAVFVRKKSGEIRLCIDYRELNKNTRKDAYPLPLPDEVQDRLAGSKVFSMLVAIGSCQCIRKTSTRQHFAQVQEWVSSSTDECPLA
jgi:hypothetical protein